MGNDNVDIEGLTHNLKKRIAERVRIHSNLYYKYNSLVISKRRNIFESF